MRRSRRGGGGHSGLEFGGSGEDSFVAVVVTKLTGALLFILLLTMVIMALLPKSIDLPASDGKAEGVEVAQPLAIATPERLPEAIAGRPYLLALAATGGKGANHWAVDGNLPDGLSIDADSGLIQGTPTRGTPEAVPLILRVADASDSASRKTALVVFQSDKPLTMPSKWLPALPPVPWREWLEQGVGFLVLALVHVLGMQVLQSLERRALVLSDPEENSSTERRFLTYRVALRLATLGATASLAWWLSRHVS